MAPHIAAKNGTVPPLLDWLREGPARPPFEDPAAAQPGEPAPPCDVLLLDGSTCERPRTVGQPCPHRPPGAAPAALARLVAALRRDVAEARQVASRLASLVRYLRGDRAVDLVLEHLHVGPQPAWLDPSEPGWPHGGVDPDRT